MQSSWTSFNVYNWGKRRLCRLLKKCKLFYITGKWEDTTEDNSIFQLFREVGSKRRFELYFILIQTVHPMVVFYALLTFVGKCFDDDSIFGVSPGYRRVITTHKSRMRKNFRMALRNFLQLEAEPSYKVLTFIYHLGL